MRRMFLFVVLLCVCAFSAVTTDTVKAKGSVLVIKDSTKFAGGAYFAGIARFAGTLYAPVVDIDSLVGDVKFGGNLFNFYSGSLTLGSNYKGVRLGRKAVLMAYQNISIAGLYMSANSYLSNSGWVAIDTGYSCVTEVTPTKFKIDFPNTSSNAGGVVTYSTKFNVDSAGNVAATAFSGPLTGNVTGNLTGRADSATYLKSNNSTDYSSSTTVTGWSSTLTKIVYYNRIGPVVFVRYSISGTSNSNYASFTLPFSVNMNHTVGTYQDNGGTYGSGVIASSGTTIYCGASLYYVDTFTASGTKSVEGQFFAFIN